MTTKLLCRMSLPLLMTGVLALPATLLFAVTAAVPLDSIVCAGSTGDDWCGVGVLFMTPAIGAIVPWTVAGLPGLEPVHAAHRKRRPRSGDTA